MPKTSRTLASLLTLAATALAGCGEGPSAAGDEQFNTAGAPLAYDSYEVLFTNPVCADYPYEQEVHSVSGELLTQKPKDVFCGYDDSFASGDRPESPQRRLLDWIADPETKEIFFTYLSFSSSTVLKALCQAVEERDVQITFVLDSSSNRTKADALMACQPSDPARAPRFERRGHTSGIGYAHNKLFMVNPGAATTKIAFSSGNMSSGVVLHHENWHFITLPGDSYFAQTHVCVMNAELDAWESKTAYRNSIESCVDAIEAAEERDIQAYFVPADRGRASKRLLGAIEQAESIDIAAHRFSYTSMVSALKTSQDESDTPIRLIADDDMYWAGQGQKVGDNMEYEFYNTKSLTNRGAEVKWMETNHDAHLLHHNKFLIFDMGEEDTDAVWCGAGNLTGTGFYENWENFYYVSIPEIVEAYREQYTHMWNELASASEDMPSENVMPSTGH